MPDTPPSLSKLLEQLRRWIDDELEAKSKKEALEASAPLAVDESTFRSEIAEFRRRIRMRRRQQIDLLKKIQQRPFWHERHHEKLDRFAREGEYDRSVFVMTKFPDDSPLGGQLGEIIRLVSKGLEQRGYHPRLAQGSNSHLQLWDEVELHLVGCSQGIAILENRFSDGLNRNVAVEMGWMLGMGKDVRCLRERGYSQLPANWRGFLAEPFTWDDPEAEVNTALNQWFGRVRRPPRRGSRPVANP